MEDKAEMTLRAYSVFLHGPGAIVLKDLRERYQHKLIPGNREATYDNALQAGVVDFIESMAEKSTK